MESEKVPQFFDLFFGDKSGSNIRRDIVVGHAIQMESESFYRLRLMMFPGITYFLSRNQEAGKYTLYAKQILTEEGSRLQNPVGFGRLLQNSKPYLEIKFRLLDALIYMDLFPKHQEAA